MKIELIDFAEAKKIWAVHLWPQRQSPIEDISYIDHRGAIDMSIKQWATPVYIGMRNHSGLIAVTSFYQTDQLHWRLRGTWTHEELRGQGQGQVLIAEVVRIIKTRQGSSRLWTMARSTAINFYLKNEFQIGQQILGYEFGPHVIMTRDIST